MLPCCKCVPQNRLTMHFDNHLDLVSRARLKVEYTFLGLVHTNPYIVECGQLWLIVTILRLV